MAYHANPKAQQGRDKQRKDEYGKIAYAEINAEKCGDHDKDKGGNQLLPPKYDHAPYHKIKRRDLREGEQGLIARNGTHAFIDRSTENIEQAEAGEKEEQYGHAMRRLKSHDGSQCPEDDDSCHGIDQRPQVAKARGAIDGMNLPHHKGVDDTPLNLECRINDHEQNLARHCLKD